MKHQFTEFGKLVRKRQIDLGLSQIQLVEMVNKESGLKLDATRLQKILNGTNGSPKAIAALKKILELE